MDWIIERVKPFQYWATASDGKRYFNKGNSLDSIVISFSNSAMISDVNIGAREQYPWLFDFPLGKIEGFISDDGLISFYILERGLEASVVAYKWQGEYLINREIPLFEILKKEKFSNEVLR